MNKSYLILLTATLLILGSCQKKQENPLVKLTDENIHTLNLYFYPSTIRMINLGNDSAFYKATKDIKSIQFTSVDLTKPEKLTLFNNWYSEQNYNDWDEIMKANMGANTTIIYAPKNTDDQYFIEMESDGTVYLLWAEGKVNFNEAIKVMQNGPDFGLLSAYMGNINKEERRREINEKTKAERQRLEKEDSINAL